MSQADHGFFPFPAAWTFRAQTDVLCEVSRPLLCLHFYPNLSRVLGFSPSPLGGLGFLCAQERGQRDASVAQGHPPLYFDLLDRLACQALRAVAAFLLPLPRSLLFLCFLAICRMLCVAAFPRGARARVLSSFPLMGSSALPCLSLGRAARVEPILRWTSAAPGLSSAPGRHQKRPRFGMWGRLLCLVGHLAGLSCFSDVLVVHQSWAPAFCVLSFAPLASAMTRAEMPEDLSPPPPPPPPATTALEPAVGTCDVDSDWEESRRGRSIRANVVSRDLPWPVAEADAADKRWLGCYVYTPHYSPVTVAVQMPEPTDLQHALDGIHDCALGVPADLFPGVVPLRPQRFPGFLQVIRFPSILKQVHDGYVAVICDLTHVGGPYFPTVLPKGISHADLTAFLLPLTSHSEDTLRFFVGCRLKVWPTEALVLLRDGDVIMGTFDPSPRPQPCRYEDLNDRATWGSLRHFFAPERHSRTCVMYRDKRYCVGESQWHGSTRNEFIVSFLGIETSRVASCQYDIRDLDVQGDHCATIIAISDVAPPTGGHQEPERRDLFVLCDLRPLGLKPKHLYTHVPRLHLRSVAADLGIALPAGYQVGVLGARLSGETVKLDGNCTPVFCAEEIESADSSSSDAVPTPQAAAVDPAAPATGSEMHVDSTIPEGHSWNSGRSADWVAATVGSHSVWDDNQEGSARVRSPRGIAQSMPDNASVTRPLEAAPAANLHPSAAGGSGADSSGYSAVPETSVTSLHDTVAPGLRAASDRARSAQVSSLREDAEPLDVVAVVYIPDVSPEMVPVRLHLPCSVDQAVAQVTAARLSCASCGFSIVTPVSPQPCLEFLVTVASPAWLVDRPIVLFDCSRINGSLFAKVLFPSATRETLLLAAGFRHDSPEEVFVHGLVQPLQVGQRIQLLMGMSISLAPPACGAPATSDLASRLQSTEGWDADAFLPGPDYAPGMHFWVLTDGWPTLFTVGAWRRQHSREDLAHQLDAREPFLVIRATQPVVHDAFFNGYLATGVWVATEKLSRVPFPPARRREDRIILVLDCRPILLGFRWLLLDSPIASVNLITGPFQDLCPDEHVVSVEGATAIPWGDECVFQLECGQVLKVSFESDLSSGNSSSPGPPPDDSVGPLDHPNHDVEGGPGSRDVPRNRGTPNPRRSRSPRQRGDRHLQDSSAQADLSVSPAEPRDSPELMWAVASPQDVVHDDMPSPTPTFSANSTDAPSPLWLCCFARYLLSDQALASHFAGQLVAMLHELGTNDAVSSDAVADGALEDEPELVQMTFVLLAPELAPEVVPMQVVSSQPTSDVLDVLDTCRGRTNWEVYPRLHSVHPQPSHRAVHVLMSPEWVNEGVVVCLDLSQYGGEVFAAASAPHVDSFTLLNMAGLSSASLLNIFVRGSVDPLAPGEEVHLVTGDCVCFAPPDSTLRELSTLQHIFRSALAAPANTAAHERAEDDRFCLVSDGAYFDFLLNPARSFLYRQDVASRLQLEPQQLLFSPARPRVTNAQVYGRPCRSVVAVGGRPPDHPDRTASIGLLDCRPILEGWRRLYAPEGWLDLAVLRAGLSQGAPMGFQVCFDALPSHWEWTWLHDGQVIRVSYRPGPDSGASIAYAAAPQGRLVHPPFPLVRSPAHAERPREHTHSVGSVEELTSQRGRAPSASLLFCTAGMWTFGSRQNAFSPGTLRFTTALLSLCTGALVAAEYAVCLIRRHCLRTMVAMTLLLFLEHLETLGVEAMQLPLFPGGPRLGLPPDSAPVSIETCALPLPTPPRARPLPTPCRNVFSGLSTCMSQAAVPAPADQTDDAFCMSDMETLLDHAARADDCQAFFLAATLVETLFEYFGSHSSSHAHTAITLPSVLSLETLLPASSCQPIEHTAVETFDLTARQCALPCSISMLQDLRRKSPFAHLQGPPGLLPEPERFVEWVAAGQVGRAPAPGELVVLTADGSFDPDTGKAGWGMVVSLVSAYDLLLPGQFAGCISGSTRELQQVLGDAFPCNNAYLAEVSGLFWAGVLAFRLPHVGSWVFRADNIGALQGVAGTVQMQDHALCRAAAAVHTAFGLLHHSATYQHVPGHSDDPANELADALAKSASRRHTTFSLPGFSLETWFAKGGIAFEWLPHMCLSDVFPDTLPKLHNDVLEWSRGAAPFSVLAADTMRPFLRAVSGVEVKRRGARQETSLVCASFNALSLLDTQPDSHAAGLHGATGRVKLLCESLESFGVHLAGIQECRTLPGTMLCRGFHRFASGRDENACYGVELWVAANGPFDPRAVTVLHKEPTFLLAGLPFLGGTLRVLVAHGPHRVHSESFRAQWWQHVTQVCAAHCRDASWIVLADANCRVGEHVSSSIGPHQADPEDFSGSFFRAFLDRFECWLPSTFANTAYGLGGTLYQRRNGEWDRSDFVAVPSTWLFSSCLAWVECSISAGHQCLDHLAVLVQCSVVDRPPARCSTRARRIDPGALADPANRMAVEEVISSAPRFPWDADASVQAAAVVDHVYRGLAALFPQQRRPMR